jgi:hypothetical protein
VQAPMTKILIENFVCAFNFTWFWNQRNWVVWQIGRGLLWAEGEDHKRHVLLWFTCFLYQ